MEQYVSLENYSPRIGKKGGLVECLFKFNSDNTLLMCSLLTSKEQIEWVDGKNLEDEFNSGLLIGTNLTKTPGTYTMKTVYGRWFIKPQQGKTDIMIPFLRQVEPLEAN